MQQIRDVVGCDPDAVVGNADEGRAAVFDLQHDPGRLDVIGLTSTEQRDRGHPDNRSRHEDLGQSSVARGRCECRALEVWRVGQQNQPFTTLGIGDRHDRV